MEDPKQIGKYEIRQYLGGGMSRVYKAWDPVMSRTVALKILTPEAAGDADAKARFLREAQTAGGLTHDNVIRVYDFGEENGRPFMVLEYLEGHDLREAIQSGQAGDLARRLEIAREAAKGVECIHEHSIIHRDIKPDNIHIDHAGRVRLIDFGIAKRLDLNLTRPGFTLGTPYYMAPEQVRGEEVSHLADIYSFGVLLFELFSGKRPFAAITGENIEQIFYRILHEPVDLAPLAERNVPQSVRGLIDRSVAKDPAARPQNMSEVRYALEAALAGGRSELPTLPEHSAPAAVPTPAPTAKSSPPRRRAWPILLAAMVVLAIIGLAYVGLRGPRPPPPKPEPEPAPLAASLSTPTGTMVLVPEGQFLFGPDSEPQSLPAFYIDRTEVTNAAYSAFCSAENRDLPPGFPGDKPLLPVVNVTFSEAVDFARWSGKRLPTAAEWEKAARGTDGRPYPWGQEYEANRANVNSGGGNAAQILGVEAFGLGASPYGAIQMAGNVWEFVDESMEPSDQAVAAFARLLSPPPSKTEAWKTIRGGAYDIPLVENVTFEWGSVPVRFRAPNIGFRCVKDPP